jgi:hypothetical protein
MKRSDFAGQIFGRLTAVSKHHKAANGRMLWLFACECGAEKVADPNEVKRGSTRSCGCLANEQRKNAAQKQTHALSRSSMPRERKSWEMMIARCHDPEQVSYKNYGALGIRVCARWLNSFENFVMDMGKRPVGMTLDRIDGSADYCLENCRWATRKEQANNRRTNHRITIDGETKTIAQWADHLGMNSHVIRSRIYKGMQDHDAVLKPLRQR